MDALADLFALADAYRAATGLAEATVSRSVLKNGNRLRDLRAKTTDIGVFRVQEAKKWFADHWPEGAAWPEGVPRPDASPSKADAGSAPEAA